MSDTAPRHDELGWVTRAIEIASMAAAGGLLLAQAIRFAGAPRWIEWWTPAAIVAGLIAADLASGVVHWFADTWGSETMPVLGRRLLRPFRVHHVNPCDFLRRDFIDTNGDVSMVIIPFLLPGFVLPLDSAVGRAATVFLAAMSLAAIPTNQVHQWAHMPHPPKWVKRLQDCHVILSRREHLRHHAEPHATHYCIALGWCNGVLSATGSFRAIERMITRLTGIQPRADDAAFAVRAESSRSSIEVMPTGSRNDANAF
jgi:ubiquitin-conjugating enzyme E2 variant